MLPGMASLLLAGGPYVPSDPDALAYFAAMPAQPSDPFKRAVNDFIVGCKADGTWTVFDRFALLCLDTPLLNKVDMRDPAKSISEFGGGTYTSGKGWKGNGSDAYLSFGVRAAFSQASAPVGQQGLVTSVHMGGYVNLAGTSGQNEPLLGTTSTSSPWNIINISNGANLFNTAVNSTKSSRTVSQVTGLFTVSRSNQSTYQIYYGDNNFQNEAATANGGDPGSIMIGRERTIYCRQRIALAYMGGFLSQTNMTALNQRIMTMLTAMGAN